MEYRLATVASWLLAAMLGPVAAHAQTLHEPFTPWPATGSYSPTSPDGQFRIDGNWCCGAGGAEILQSGAAFSLSPNGKNGYLNLTVPGGQTQTPYHAGEWASTLGLNNASGQPQQGYGYGYYETRMKVTPVAGVCASFFWIENTNGGFGPHEWDIEFLTNEFNPNAYTGTVHLTIHLTGGAYQTYVATLPFNPSKAFHRYGFLWRAGAITFTADGQAIYTFTNSDLNTTALGYMLGNEWVGGPNWGGGPPAADAVTSYDFVRFGSNAPAIPSW